MPRFWSMFNSIPRAKTQKGTIFLPIWKVEERTVAIVKEQRRFRF